MAEAQSGNHVSQLGGVRRDPALPPPNFDSARYGQQRAQQMQQQDTRMANNADPSTLAVHTQRVIGHSQGAKGTSDLKQGYNPAAPPRSHTPGQ